MISHQPDTMKRMRRYLGQWSRWLKLGLTTIKEFATSVETHLPSLFRVGGRAPYNIMGCSLEPILV